MGETPTFKVEVTAIDWPLWILIGLFSAVLLSDLFKPRNKG
jgi:hypothetical protein